jgi:orotidine-5'-phosphate decarboxylase
MMTDLTFGQRLRAALDAHGPLCAGIDPHRALVESWGLGYDVEGLARFTDACVEAFAGQVGVVKPQSAFFEVFGSRGVAVLERAILALREAGTLVILDAKRGDIGSTMAAYAEAYLGKDAVAPADAVTASPYLGFESLRPALDLAAQTRRGVFVLGLTSNPEGRSVQHARLDGVSVAEAMVQGAATENAAARQRGELGSVGLVVGATVGSAVQELGIDLAASHGPLLAPGVGAQGGTAEDLRRVFGDALPNVLAASSRDVLTAGPDATTLRERALRTSEELAAVLR